MYEGYQKYPEGSKNIRRVSEMTVEYRKCMKGIKKLKKTKHWVSIGYRKYSEGIENIRWVSEMTEGYRKLKKNLILGFNRVSEISRGYGKH